MSGGLLEDTDRNIWIGTELGVSRYDRSKNEFKNYLFPGHFNTPAGAPYGRTFRIFQDAQKELWAVTAFVGLLHYNKAIDNWEFANYEVPGVELPDHYEVCISFAEDDKGGLWFGSTNYSLMHRAKGDTVFRQVQHELAAKLKFENVITGLYFDSAQTLWITSRTGVHKYNPETGYFKTIIAYTEGNEDTANHWNKILPDKEGNIWIANNFRGILKFDGITDNYTEIEIAGKLKMRTHGWNITLTNFMIDQSGIFWFGSRESGLVKYDPVNKPFQHLAHDPANPNSLSSGGVFGILASKTKPGVVYVGTHGNGINIYDPQKQTFEKVTFKVIDDVFNGAARSIGEDPDGSLWLGTWGDGLIKLDKNYKEIKRYKYDPLNKNSISNNQVRVIKPDNQGRLWLGTNNGLNILNPKTNSVQRVASKSTRQYPDQLVAEMDKLIASEQKMSTIEKAIDNQNLSIPIEIKTAEPYWVMAVGEGDVASMADYGWIENAARDTVWQMGDFENTFYAGGAVKNRIDIGAVTLQPGSYTLHYKTDDSHAFGKWNSPAPDQTRLYGIALIKPQNDDQLKSFQAPTNPESQELLINGFNIYDIEVTDKFIWVTGDFNGLDRIDPVTNQVKHYAYDPENNNSLSNNNIRDIFEDSRGMIWLATGEGLSKLDPATETFTRYSETDGLPTNLTEGIVEGDDGEMWIATQNGLSQMVSNEKLSKVTFINYNSTDGLGGDTFLSLATARAVDGRFYFGGDHGLTTFSKVTSNKTPPAIILSNLFISNKSISDIKEDSPLTESLQETKNISLSFNQNNLSFEFAALHYANPKKNQYAHMLKGYDQDWIYDNRNFAAYTNLDPGKYEFKVRAANAYGIWNEEGLTLEITILPPWWRTWWAYALYVVLLAAFAFTADRTVRRSIKIRERERSRERELKQAKEIEMAYVDLKATQAQLIQSEKLASLGQLAAGIAHEIKNPMNFINNFSELSLEYVSEIRQELNKLEKNETTEEIGTLLNDVEDNLKKVHHHGTRADNIVKSMLMHSRGGSGKMEPTDANALIKEYVNLAFHGMRAGKTAINVKIDLDLDDSLTTVDLNPEDFSRVILNLCKNAFDAMRTKGLQPGYQEYKPVLKVSTKNLGNGIAAIDIEDNGPGVSETIKDKLFQPFFTTKKGTEGTGLGLSITHDIIKKHNGIITIASTENTFTRFEIRLPITTKNVK